MAELQMYKSQGSLRPAQQADSEALDKVRSGVPVLCKIIQMRNPLFHAKFFAMLGLAYEYFEPEIEPTKSGLVPQKNFERFREDVTIMAGYREVVVNIKGEVRYQAKSISFGSMEETEFNDLYKAVFNVCWLMVLQKVHGMTEAVAENTINQMMSFH